MSPDFAFVCDARGSGFSLFSLKFIELTDEGDRALRSEAFKHPLKLIEDCCQRHQLTVRLAAGFGERNEKAIDTFARQLIQRTVKRRNGLPIEPDVLTLLARFGKPETKTVPEAVTEIGTLLGRSSSRMLRAGTLTN